MDLVLELGPEELDALRKAFVATEDGLPMDAFVGTVLGLLPDGLFQSESAYADAAARLCDMFSLVDLDGNGSMDWEEFTRFMIESVENSEAKHERLKNVWHERQGACEHTMHRTVIEHVRYIPGLQKLFAMERETSECRVFDCAVRDPEAGFPLLKRIRTVGADGAPGADLVDVTFMEDHSLLCFCVEDFSFQLYDAKALKPSTFRFEGHRAIEFEALDATVREAGATTGVGVQAIGVEGRAQSLVHDAEAQYLRDLARTAKGEEASMRALAREGMLSVGGVRKGRPEIHVPMVASVHTPVLQRMVVYVQSSQILLSAGSGPEIFLWNVTVDRSLDGTSTVRVRANRALVGHSSSIYHIIPCGQPIHVAAGSGKRELEGYIASLDAARKMSVWKYRGKGISLAATKESVGFPILCAEFCDSAGLLLVGGRSHRVLAFDINADDILHVMHLGPHDSGIVIAIAAVPNRAECVTLDNVGVLRWWNLTRSSISDEHRLLQLIDIPIPAGTFHGRDLIIMPSLPQLAVNIFGPLWDGLPFLLGGAALRIGGVAAGAELARQIVAIQRRTEGKENPLSAAIRATTDAAIAAETLARATAGEEGDEGGGAGGGGGRRSSIVAHRSLSKHAVEAVRRVQHLPRGILVAVGDRMRFFESIPATDEFAKVCAIGYDHESETLEVILERDTCTVDLTEGKAIRLREEVTGSIHVGAELHPMGRKLLIGTEDGRVGVYNRSTGAGLVVLRPHSTEVTGFEYVPQDSLLISCDAAGCIAVSDELMDAMELEKIIQKTKREEARQNRAILAKRAAEAAAAARVESKRRKLAEMGGGADLEIKEDDTMADVLRRRRQKFRNRRRGSMIAAEIYTEGGGGGGEGDMFSSDEEGEGGGEEEEEDVSTLVSSGMRKMRKRKLKKKKREAATESSGSDAAGLKRIPPGAVRFLEEAHGKLIGVTELKLAFELSLLVTGGADGSMRVWDFQQFLCEGSLHGHSNEITAINTLDPRPAVVSADASGNIALFHMSRCLSGGVEHGLPIVAWRLPLTTTMDDDSRQAAMIARREKRMQSVHTSKLEKGRRLSAARRRAMDPPQGSEASDAVVTCMQVIVVDHEDEKAYLPSRAHPGDRILAFEGTDDGRLVVHDITKPITTLRMSDHRRTTTRRGSTIHAPPHSPSDPLLFDPVGEESIPVARASYEPRAHCCRKGPTSATPGTTTSSLHFVPGLEHPSAHTRSAGPSPMEAVSAMHDAVERGAQPKDSSPFSVSVIAAEAAHPGFMIRSMCFVEQHGLLITSSSLGHIRVWDLRPFVKARPRAPLNSLAAICRLDFGDNPLTATPLTGHWMFPVPKETVLRRRQDRARVMLAASGILKPESVKRALHTTLATAARKASPRLDGSGEEEEEEDEDGMMSPGGTGAGEMTSAQLVRLMRRIRTRDRLAPLVNAVSAAAAKRAKQRAVIAQASSVFAKTRRSDIVSRLQEASKLEMDEHQRVAKESREDEEALERHRRQLRREAMDARREEERAMMEAAERGEEEGTKKGGVGDGEDDEEEGGDDGEMEEEVHDLSEEEEDEGDGTGGLAERRSRVVLKVLERPWEESGDEDEDGVGMISGDDGDDDRNRGREDDEESLTFRILASVDKLGIEDGSGHKTDPGEFAPLLGSGFDAIEKRRKLRLEEKERRGVRDGDDSASRLYPSLLQESSRHAVAKKEHVDAVKVLRMQKRDKRITSRSIVEVARKEVGEDGGDKEAGLWEEVSRPSAWLEQHAHELPMSPTPKHFRSPSRTRTRTPKSTRKVRMHLPPPTPLHTTSRALSSASGFVDTSMSLRNESSYESTIDPVTSESVTAKEEESLVKDSEVQSTLEAARADFESLSMTGLAKIKARLHKKGLQLRTRSEMERRVAREGVKHVALAVSDLEDYAARALLEEEMSQVISVHRRKTKEVKRKDAGEGDKVGSVSIGGILARGKLTSLEGKVVPKTGPEARKGHKQDKLEKMLTAGAAANGAASGVKLARRKRFGPYPRKEVVAFRSLWQRVDKDGSGDISREEFLSDPMMISGDHRSTQLEAMFDAVDRDGSGTISLVEFARTYFPKASAKVFRDILSYVNWKPLSSISTHRVRRKYSPAALRKMRVLFRTYDADNSGYITKAELVEGMERVKRVFSKAELMKMEARTAILAPAAKYRATSREHDMVTMKSRKEIDSQTASALALLGLIERDIDELIESVDKDENAELDFEEFVCLFGPTFEPDAPFAIAAGEDEEE